MMKPFLLYLMLASVPLVSRGSIPIPQPLPEACADFQKVYPARCEELIIDIRSRIAAKQGKDLDELLEPLKIYRDNLRADILEAQHAFAELKDPSVLPFTLHKICTDLVGFRRSLDALLMEGSASKTTTVDEVRLTEIRKFLKEEYYFGWRFGSEIAPRLHQ